jgi:hypothetical protein
MLKTSGILLDFPLPRYEGCDNWNNLPGKIATHQKTVSVTRSADQHRFGLLTIDKTGSPNWIILWQKMLYPCIVVPLCTDASYYQLEPSAPNSWINPFHEKLFEYSGCRLPQRHSIRLPRGRQSLHFLEHPQLLFELAASDPFLDSERLILGLFYDPDDFVFAEIVHGTTLLFHVHCSHIVQKQESYLRTQRKNTC